MTTLQSKLRNGTSVEQLQEEFKLSVKTHKEYPQLKLFKYDQIKSPFQEKIVQESRGIVLDEGDNWNIVAFPYEKFFNLGESLAAAIDLNSLQVATKEDGSLMTLYYYDNNWQVASSGTPDASGRTCSGISYKKVFWDTWNELNYKLPTDTNFCYMFELCTRDTIVVVEHLKSRIIFHGARNLKTFREVHPNQIGENYNWEIVKYHDLKTLEQVKKYAEEFTATENEGFIAVDKDFNRVKIKSIQYVEFHHTEGAQKHDDASILKIIQTNESEEYLAYFPKYKERHNEILEIYRTKQKFLEELYESIDCDNIKEFALALKGEPFSSVLFQLKRSKIPIVDGLATMETKMLLKKLAI